MKVLYTQVNESDAVEMKINSEPCGKRTRKYHIKGVRVVRLL